MNTQHTSGPWELSSTEKGDEYATVILGGRFNGVVARAEITPYNSIDEAEANARLIASAPDLLSIAKELRNTFYDLHGHGVEPESFPKGYVKGEGYFDIGRLEHIIASAEGK